MRALPRLDCVDGGVSATVKTATASVATVTANLQLLQLRVSTLAVFATANLQGPLLIPVWQGVVVEEMYVGPTGLSCDVGGWQEGVLGGGEKREKLCRLGGRQAAWARRR